MKGEYFADLFKGNRNLYFCQFDHSVGTSELLARKIAEWGSKFKVLVSFDRSLWSSLSAGLMPAELFQFHLNNIDNEKISRVNSCSF